MFAFSVFLLGPILVQGIELKQPSGLNFDVNQEYATSYEDYKPSDYKFEYGVSDPHTGDHKSHWETRENGVVRGEYRLLEPDGTTRIVQYTADDHNGFRATIKKIGHAVHPSSIPHSPVKIGHAVYPSSIPHSPVAHDIPDSPELHHNHKAEYNFKAYDGSRENYINTLPSQVPYYAGDTIHDHLPLGGYQGDVHPAEVHPVRLFGIQPPKTLPQEPNSIPNLLPSQEHNHVHLPPIEIIKKEEYISDHIEEPAYIPENAQIHYSKGISIPLQMQEPVITSPLVPDNIEYSSSPIYVQNGMGYPEKNVVEDRHSSVIEPLSIGLRIDHPHGESSSSFYGKTGNIEDDRAYTNHEAGGAISGW